MTVSTMEYGLEKRFEERYIPEPNSGCWLWIGAGINKKNTYGRLMIAGKNMKAHRVSWMIHNGPIPEGLCVLHKCDTPDCVNPNHLFLGTPRDNNHDMMKKGRAVFSLGEKNGYAKLTQKDVLEIKEALAAGNLPCDIAINYSVASRTISDIDIGKTWKHLSNEAKAEGEQS